MARAALTPRACVFAAGLLLSIAATWVIWVSRPAALQERRIDPATATAQAPFPGTAIKVEGIAPAAGTPAAAPSAANSGADGHALFVQRIKHAREAPRSPAPSAVAAAKSFPEAVEALRAAQLQARREPPPGSAAINPFAPATP